MAETSYVQPSFLGGEWSQSIQGRTDRPDYRTALNVCLNAFPIETGAWCRRPGFQLAGPTRSGNPGRVIKFDFQQMAPYTMEFTDGFLEFWSGTTLVTTNDSQTITSLSTANPALLTVPVATNWVTGDQGYFTNLGATCPQLQNRMLSLTKVSTTTFTLTDAITGVNINGTTVGAGTISAGAVFNHALQFPAPYSAQSWQGLRSVQTETTAFLLLGTQQPYAVTVSAQPNKSAFATLALNAAIFNDGPYLDPFANGVQANLSPLSGISSLTLSFPLWSATVAYAQGAFVISSSICYQSLLDQNVNHTPASSPTYWAAVSPGNAINNGKGFLGSDVGRLIRLFSEPLRWNPLTTYAVGNIVSYNPSGDNISTTYWQSLTNGNIGHPPGADITNWQIVPQGPTTAASAAAAAQTTATSVGAQGPAIWTWGKIVSLLNVISGTLPGSTNIGDMTSEGGLAGAFDGTLNQLAAASAVRSTGVVAGFFPAGTYGLSSYVGKNYTGAAAQKISQATIYPTTDNGFVTSAVSGTLNVPFTSVSFTMNLRGKATLPASGSDGTLLGTSGPLVSLFTPVTIISSDQTTAWNYVWIEFVTTAYENQVFADYIITNYISQVVLINPTGTGLGTGVMVEILGPALLYTTPVYTWRLGAYSNTTGFPTCGTYSDGRLWLSGAIANRIDACKSNGIELVNGYASGTVDWSPTDQYGVVAANAALSYTFNAPDTNPIFWMLPDLQGIICGTKAGEWLITAPTAGGISPLNISARRVTTIGAANIEPRRTEHTAIFVQKFSRKVMEYFADVYSGKFTAPHITYTFKHLTYGGVKEIAYQQELNPVVWMRVASGVQLVGCTYRRDTLSTAQGPTFAGGHRHTLGSGRVIESLTVGPSVGGNLDAVTIVSNEPATGIRFVEVSTDLFEEGTPLTSAFHVDAGIIPSSYVVNDMTNLIVNGLWNLNGKTVDAWLGGYDCGSYVVTNGSITVPFGDGVGAGTGGGLFTAAYVNTFTGLMPGAVGFSFTSRGQIIRPALREETGTRAGPGLGKKRRNEQFAVQLAGCITGSIQFGTDYTKTLHAAIFKSGGGNVYPLLTQFSGVYWDTVEDDYSFDGMLCWQVTRPYPVILTAIGGYIKTQDK